MERRLDGPVTAADMLRFGADNACCGIKKAAPAALAAVAGGTRPKDIKL